MSQTGCQRMLRIRTPDSTSLHTNCRLRSGAQCRYAGMSAQQAKRACLLSESEKPVHLLQSSALAFRPLLSLHDIFLTARTAERLANSPMMHILQLPTRSAQYRMQLTLAWHHQAARAAALGPQVSSTAMCSDCAWCGGSHRPGSHQLPHSQGHSGLTALLRARRPCA